MRSWLANATSSMVCTACAAGTYAMVATGASVCTACGAGTYRVTNRTWILTCLHVRILSLGVETATPFTTEQCLLRCSVGVVPPHVTVSRRRP